MCDGAAARVGTALDTERESKFKSSALIRNANAEFVISAASVCMMDKKLLQQMNRPEATEPDGAI